MALKNMMKAYKLGNIEAGYWLKSIGYNIY